jgi:hypothetical protein
MAHQRWRNRAGAALFHPMPAIFFGPGNRPRTGDELVNENFAA